MWARKGERAISPAAPSRHTGVFGPGTGASLLSDPGSATGSVASSKLFNLSEKDT